MGKFMDQFIPKPGYRVVPPPPIPERKEEERTGTYVNESGRAILVKLYDDGTPDGLARLLGELELAKDVVKSQISNWHVREEASKKLTSGTIVPKVNGN